MADFLEALKQEIEEIEAQLKADPRFQKLESLRNVLALYGDNGVAREKSAQPPYRTSKRQPSEARARVLELSELFLRNRHDPTPTREIYDHVRMLGGEIGGKDPVSNLSAMLSNSDRFQSNGRAGWTIAGHVIPDPEGVDSSDDIADGDQLHGTPIIGSGEGHRQW